MSRIILSTYPNGQERVVVGYDGPLGFFAHEYDDEGEALRDVGMGGGIDTTEKLAREAAAGGITITWSVPLRDTLRAHTRLEYPASNVIVDFTQEEWNVIGRHP